MNIKGLMKTRDLMNITMLININGSMKIVVKLDSFSLASVYMMEWRRTSEHEHRCLKGS